VAINKYTRAALKALSYPDFDIKKNYKAQRIMDRIMHPPISMSFVMWDHRITTADHDIPVRIFSPKIQMDDAVFVFFHGGGWVTGDINSYTMTCSLLAENTGRRVLSVDYRLAPEFPFPCAPEDCYIVTREIFKNSSQLNILPEKIILIGDSAGGNLAAAVSLMARDRGEFKIHRQILIYPATNNDHTPSSQFDSIRENGEDYLLTSKKICDYMDLYLQDKSQAYNPYFAPILADDLSDQPDTLIITAEYDPLRDEGEAYGEKLRRFGADVEIHRMPDALHGYFSLPPRFVLVRKTYELINSFISKPIH